jgi:hypothetical protein
MTSRRMLRLLLHEEGVVTLTFASLETDVKSICMGADRGGLNGWSMIDREEEKTATLAVVAVVSSGELLLPDDDDDDDEESSEIPSEEDNEEDEGETIILGGE